MADDLELTSEVNSSRRVTWEDIDREIEKLRQHSLRLHEANERSLLDFLLADCLLADGPSTIQRKARF